MKRAFRIKPDDTNWLQFNPFHISAVRKCYMPGITCSFCRSSWATTGISYPGLNCQEFGSISKMLRPNLVDLNSYKELLYKLQTIIGNSIFIPPGTNFGPLFGTSNGIPGNFLWLNPWTPLITQSTLDILLSNNINIVAVKNYIKHKTHKSFYELEALPLFNIYYKDSGLSYDCKYCNKPNKNIVTNNIVIDSNSFDESIPIQRCKELPTILLINQQFARIIIDLNLSNIIIDEVVLN